MTNSNSTFWQRNSRSAGNKPGMQHGAPLSPEQITELLQRPDLRLTDYPATVAMAQQLQVEPDDPQLTELLWLSVSQRVAIAQSSNDAFLGEYPPKGAIPRNPEDVHVLTLSTGDELGLSPPRLMSNLITSGPTGTGKSTLTRDIAAQLPSRGFVVVYFDRKREARRLLAHPELHGLVTVLDVERLPISPYQEIPGVDRRVSTSATTELFARNTGRMFAQRTLHEVAEILLSQASSGAGLPIDILIDGLKRVKPWGGGRQADLKESMLLALVHIKASFGAMLNYHKSDLLPAICRVPHLFIIELHVLPADMYMLLVTLFMQSLYLERLHVRQPNRLPVVFMLDDATVAVDAQMDRDSVGGTSPLAEQLLMGRGLGMGVVIDVHDISAVSPKILRNCETEIFTGSRGENPRFLQDRAGLTPEQVEQMRGLQPGQAVALVPSKWPRPLLGTFAPDMSPDVSDDMCRASADRFLAGVHVEAYVPPVAVPGVPTTPRNGPMAAPAPSDIEKDAIPVLLQLQVGRVLPVTSLYDRLNLSRPQGVRLLTRLENVGLVRPHRFSTGRRGGMLTLYEIADAGWHLLEKFGLLKRPKPRTHGGFEHELAAEALDIVGRSLGHRTDYEIDLGAVRIDARWQSDHGASVFFQIGLNDPQREAQALAKAAHLAAVKAGKLILIARDKGLADKVMAILRQLVPDHTVADGVETKLIGVLLDKAISLNVNH